MSLGISDVFKRLGIGLTGGVATGKSTVSKILKEKFGYLVVDADQLARQVVEPDGQVFQDIVNYFGPEILTQELSLNRALLREKIFQSKADRVFLEGVVHPAIHKQTNQILKTMRYDQSPKFWFYEAALLCETGTYKNFYQLWVTHCSFETQIERLQKRDNIDSDLALKMIQGQMPSQEKCQIADFVINTESDLTELEKCLSDKLQDYKKSDKYS
jgi:dephospho-CoA kinase